MAVYLRLHTPFRNADLAGNGYFAGEAPISGGPDGRFTILGAPSQGRVTAYERSSMKAAGSTFSASDGTWRIENLSTAIEFVVIGWNDVPVTTTVDSVTVVVNAAIADHRYPTSM